MYHRYYLNLLEIFMIYHYVWSFSWLYIYVCFSHFFMIFMMITRHLRSYNLNNFMIFMIIICWSHYFQDIWDIFISDSLGPRRSHDLHPFLVATKTTPSRPWRNDSGAVFGRPGDPRSTVNWLVVWNMAFIFPNVSVHLGLMDYSGLMDFNGF